MGEIHVGLAGGEPHFSNEYVLDFDLVAHSRRMTSVCAVGVCGPPVSICARHLPTAVAFAVRDLAFKRNDHLGIRISLAPNGGAARSRWEHHVIAEEMRHA